MIMGEQPGAGALPNPHRLSYAPPAIRGSFLGKHIVSVDQFARPDLEIILDAAKSISRRMRQRDRGLTEICSGKVMASLFFESSTRTDMSFQAAMRRLGGDVIAASNGIQFSSMYKGENLPDHVRAAGCYADVIAFRHPQIGSSYEAAYYSDRLSEVIDNPTVIISGGDGIGEHPTQALLDLYTIADSKRKLDGLTITMVGDLRNGRTVHSLAKLLAFYEAEAVTVALVSPESLRLPAGIVALMERYGIQVEQSEKLDHIIGETDVIYWTRVQEERFADRAEYESIRDDFIMTPQLLKRARRDAILMHPLPRKHEMGTQADHDLLDRDPRAIYFKQMENGMIVRMALLAKVLTGAYV
jgi:aspartate carbamoyltransferase